APEHFLPVLLERHADDALARDPHVARRVIERRDVEAHAPAHERGLAASRFAGDAQDFALLEREGHAIDRLDAGAEAREVVDAEILDFEYGVGHRAHFLSRGLKTPSMAVLITYRAKAMIVTSTIAGTNAHHAPSVSASLRIASFRILPSETESYGPRPSMLMLASDRIPVAVCRMNTMKMYERRYGRMCRVTMPNVP